MTIKNSYAKEPTMCNELVYEDSELKLIKLWTWNVKGLNEEEESGVLKVLLSGMYYNLRGKSTFVSYDGKRLTDIEMDWVCDYEDEMWLFAIYGNGYGYFDKNINLVIPPKYHYANYFRNGYASVNDGNEWLYVNKKGNEIRLKNKYEKLGDFSDGMALVSTMLISRNDLRYATDYEDNIGYWGYIDKNGNEVIKPQYIYAFDFENDRAIVAKGKWEKKKKWNNEYWTEDELWGVIDKNGNEIIPCKYDEIKQFMNDDFSTCTDYYIVHIGGWKDGKWAILDRNGNSVTKPIFKDIIGSDYFNGLFTYYDDDTWDDVPCGIYDLNENKILFEPQFEDVVFNDDGNILVKVFDKDLGHKVEKIIDRTGKEVFKSDYTSIYSWKKPIIAIKEGENSTTFNIIDEKGNILDSIEFKEKVSLWNNEIDYKTKTYIYSESNKKGLKNFDGKILIPAQYEYFIKSKNGSFYYFEAEKDRNKKGIMKSDGTVIINPEYDSVTVLDNNKIICKGKNGVELYEYQTK